jgi:purine-binding chemotaxis protein CheW
MNIAADTVAPLPVGAAPARAASASGRAPQGAPVAREVLSFRLGSEEYGIDILRVQEIRSYEPCTRIAGSPAFVKGVVNLRGAIVPVIDLRVRFALENTDLGPSTATIVLNVLGRVIGVVVDSVSDVLALADGQVLPPPRFNGSFDAAHITGIATVPQGERQRMLLLIDIDTLMSGADMGLAGTASN